MRNSSGPQKAMHARSAAAMSEWSMGNNNKKHNILLFLQPKEEIVAVIKNFLSAVIVLVLLLSSLAQCERLHYSRMLCCGVGGVRV
jgi:hypothetical protein